MDKPSTITFGTDGIRGNADAFPFTPDALNILASAIGQWAVGRYGDAPRVLVCHDTRESCGRIKRTLIDGLMAVDVQVTDAGVLPTPALLALMRGDAPADFGIAISASHNVYSDNGIKLVDAVSGKLGEGDEGEIEGLFNKLSLGPSIHFAPQNTQGERSHQKLESRSANSLVLSDREAIVSKDLSEYLSPHEKSYLTTLHTALTRNGHTLDLTGQTVVLDCAHGATHRVAPALFRSFDATVITIGCKPDGININHNVGALHPATLQKAVREHNATIGFAFDGDGDRVMAVSGSGEIKDGDDLMAILLEHPTYKDADGIVGTVMTNVGLERHLSSQNKNLIRTRVGDKHVSKALEKYNLPLGGETSGHIIVTDYQPSGDGLFVALRVMQTITATDNMCMTTFQKYPQVMINVPVTCKDDLTKEPYCSIIDQSRTMLGNGRLIVRYSGTEDVLRVMAEDTTEHGAQSCAQSTATTLAHALQQRSHTSLEAS